MALALTAVAPPAADGHPLGSAELLLQDTVPPVRDRLKPRLERKVDQPPDSLAARDTAAADSARLDQGPPFPAPDSVMRLLMERPGFRPVSYRGDTLRFSARNRAIHIQRRARVERAGEQLMADSVIYEGESRFMTAYGESTLINANGEEVTSDSGPLVYDTERRIGTIKNANTQWQVWNVHGDFTLEGSDTLWVKRGSFTSCELPVPHYHFAADRIKMVLGHIVVAWPVRLYFGKVPVFWFPFFAQDIRKGRHSGILTPRFGVNDIVRNSRSFDRHISNVGYYWAISDYMDAELSLDWWSSRWTRIDGFFRYRWRRQFLDGRLGYSHFFLPDGARELSATWNHSQKFGERSDLRASVEFVSSQEFQQRNEFNPERLTQQIRSDVGFTRRFDWGTLNASAQRLQPLTEGRTELSLPQLALSLTPLTLFEARTPLEASWYNGLTWTGSANFGRRSFEEPGAPDQSVINGSVTSGFSLGNLRWNSNGSFRQQVVSKADTLITLPDTSITGNDTTVTQDTLVLGPEVRDGTLSWRTSVGYQQRLIGSTTLTPAVDLQGTLFRSNETDQSFVAGPSRVSLNATLNTDVYGFFPGPFSVQRIRHKLSPSLRWSFSPEATPSAEVEGLRTFNPQSAQEQHRLSLTVAQTFEAKLQPRTEPERSDTLGADTSAADTTRAGDGRRSDQSRKLTLLAIRTSTLTYDFVEDELISDRLENNITSDLLRGLTVRVEHDLFDETAEGGRRFDPFLSAVNLSFSLGDRTFRGLFDSESAGISEGRGILPKAREQEAASDTTQLEQEEERRSERSERRPWNVSVDYSLVRQRPAPGDVGTGLGNRQSLRLNLGFSPTENWSVRWRTQYDLERGEFVDHSLSLRRDLHHWEATFDFLQASNDNFLFEFRVNLTDLPDIKFDYRQESQATDTS